MVGIGLTQFKEFFSPSPVRLTQFKEFFSPSPVRWLVVELSAPPPPEAAAPPPKPAARGAPRQTHPLEVDWRRAVTCTQLHIYPPLLLWIKIPTTTNDL